MHTREAYYKKKGELMKSEGSFNKESEKYIGDLDFDGSSVHSALQCLERLSITVPKDYRKPVIDMLEKDFNDMLDKIREYYNKHTF